jgi:diguanylate cyclase (GGDEF)-like protein
MFEPINIGLFASIIQAVGILLIACLLYPLTRAMRAPFLRYWSLGWASLAVSLLSLIMGFELARKVFFPEDYKPVIQTIQLMIYCQGGYLFGFLLWRGSRAIGTDEPIHRRDWLVLIVPLFFGFLAPILLQKVNVLFPFHAAMMSIFYVLAFISLRRVKRGPLMPRTGYLVMCLMLILLAALFLHYTAVSAYFQFWVTLRPPTYMLYSSFVDTFLQTGLAFGMIVLSADKLRESLELKNLELAEAARTDRLTGLLNRRGLDELLTSIEAPTAGCLAALDLNDLKPLNDRYGHATGDIALQLVARALRFHFRVTDPLFRLGGDEFLVLISGWSEEQLSERLSQLDQSLNNLRLPGVPEPIDLVVAWGVASFSKSSEILQALEKADQLMYQRKRSRKTQRAAG